MGTSRRKAGLLGSEVEGYRAWLMVRGYTPPTVRNMLKDLGQVGRWLRVQGLEVGDLNERRMAAFLADRHAVGKRRALGLRAMAPLLAYLRAVGAAPDALPSPAPFGHSVARQTLWQDD
jgi:hypothetical protein